MNITPSPSKKANHPKGWDAKFDVYRSNTMTGQPHFFRAVNWSFVLTKGKDEKYGY